MRILFLVSRFPYPPLKGDQVRAYHQIRLLSERHTITILAYADKRVRDDDYAHLAKMCERVVLVPRSLSSSVSNLAKAFFYASPFQTLWYLSSNMLCAVQRELARGSYDLAHTQLVRMAPFLEEIRGIPRVIDLIDALSVNMERRAHADRGLLRWAAKWECMRLQRYERRVCENYDRATVVSKSDRTAIGEFENLHINPNGVDFASFARPGIQRENNTLIFTGNMRYFPNTDAITYFSEQVFPIIKKEVQSVQLKIVGADPPKAVKRLALDPAVSVTGWVPDLIQHLSSATVSICPMRAGSGMQFKVIEAMAAGTPVVATPFALGGLDAVDGQHLLVAKDAPEFASRVVRLLQDKALRVRIANNARQLVRDRYTWEATVEALERVYEKAIDGKSHHLH